MSDRRLDVLFVHPGSQPIYQALRGKHSAVEPPTWALLLAQSCRAAGFGAAILDCDAEQLTDEQAVEEVRAADPRLVVFAVYGSEPNQGTARMSSAVPLAKKLKEAHPQYHICFAGSHAQALPLEVLVLPPVDFVLLNEGVYALRNLLAMEFERVKGIGWKFWVSEFDGCVGRLNAPERVVPQDRMDVDLPGYAWDLIDLRKYRSHFWHGEYKHEARTPFAALYTSLGCPFKCQFCMINSLNRVDNSEGITAADSPGMRWWSASQTLKEIDALLTRGVRTIRLSDEMFFLNRKHYEPIVDGLVQRNGDDSLRLWAYARVDTVKPALLAKFRKAGIRWLCLGIESANQTIRREVTKGSYEEVDIREVVRQVEDAGIDVIANYIFGLPHDTHETMRQTLDLSIELNTRMWNAYPAMCLPGSPLYEQARKDGRELPDSYEAFGFLSYECQPLGTDHLTPAEVLRFRDDAFHEYWNRPALLSKLESKFGTAARDNVVDMLRIRLRRRLLGDPPPEKGVTA